MVIDLTKLEAVSTRGRGRTKSQTPLYPLQLTEPNSLPTDFLRIFLLVVTAAYCKHLDPPVEDGTISSFAVLGYLSSEKARPKWIAQVCSNTTFTQKYTRHTHTTYILFVGKDHTKSLDPQDLFHEGVEALVRLDERRKRRP